MKTTGIVFIVIGILSTLGALLAAANGKSTSFAGLTFVVLGAFMLNQAQKKEAEEKKKKDWAEQSKKDDAVK